MGQGESKEHPLEAFYRLHGHPDATGVIGAGEDGFLSADKYGAGVKSRAKREMIKKIAAEMAEKLKLTDLDPKNKTVDQIVEQLRKVIPDPREGKGNGKSWSAASAGVACRKIGEILNKSYGVTVVDPNASEHEICEQVAEVMNSLLTDLTEEVSGMRSDINRAVKNMETVLHFLNRIYNTIVDKIASDKDSNLAGQTAALRSIYEEVKKELERQMVLLKNMIGVLDPSAEKLDLLTQHSGEFKHLIRKIKGMPGSTEFGKKVALALSSMGTVMEVAKIVDDALKTVGISVSEYKKLKDPKEIITRFADLTKSKLSESLDSGDIYKFLKAVLVIYKHHYLHDDIVQALEKRGGAVGGLKLDKRVKMRSRAIREVLKLFNARLGDLFAHILEHAQAVGKAVDDGIIPLSDHLDNFARAIELIPDIRQKYIYYALSGYRNDITARQDREDFLSSIHHVNEVLKELMADERYKKSPHFSALHKGFTELYQFIEEFAARFREGMGIPLQKTCDPAKLDEPKKGKVEGGSDGGCGTLGSDEFGGGLNPMHAKQVALMAKSIAQAAIRNAPKALDKTADIMQIATDIARQLSMSADLIRSTASVSAPVTGSDENETDEPDEGFTEAELEDAECEPKSGSAETSSPAIARIGMSLQQIKSTILYYFRTAKIRANLRKASEEMKCYSESYEKVVGDAIAGAIEKLVKEKEAIRQNAAKYEEDQLYMALLLREMDSTVAEEVDNNGVNPPNCANADNIQRGKAKEKYDKIINYQCERIDAQILMYKIAEAVDLYMCAFTDKLTEHPEELKDVVKILGETEVISKWFSDSFGDTLCKVFDTFPGGFTLFKPRHIKVEDSKDHYYVKIAKAIGITTAIPVGESYYTNAAGRNLLLPGVPIFGIPYVGTSDYDGEHALDLLTKNFDISALKNIIAVFVNVAGKLGGEDLFKKVPMSPIQIYRGLRTYMIQSAFNLGVDDSHNVDTYRPTGTAGLLAPNKSWQDPNDAERLRMQAGFGNTVTAVVAGRQSWAKALFKTYVTMTMAESSFKAFRSGSEEADQLFVLVIKAIVAKIFTAIGTFNMFHRPITEHALGYSSGLRTILGGDVSSPEVVPEAMELYLRLPLLAEFYRRIFNFNEINDTRAFRKITMIPEMDGVFSDLINFVFDEAQHVKGGEYSDTDVRKLIEIINAIYVKFRGKQDPVTSVIQEFIAEVNRRYGVLKREERLKYIEKREKRYEDKYKPSDEDVEFDLHGIDEYDNFARPAPSASFMSAGATLTPEHKYSLALREDMEELCKLTEAINKVLKLADPGEKDLAKRQDHVFKQLSFDQMIRSRREELSHAKSETEKFDIVHSMISTLGQFALPALEKSLIAFHEMVIAPLNLLSLAYTELNLFISRINAMGKAIDTVREYLRGQMPSLFVGTGGFPMLPTGQVNVNTLGGPQALVTPDPNTIFDHTSPKYIDIWLYLSHNQLSNEDTLGVDLPPRTNLIQQNVTGFLPATNAVTTGGLTYLLQQNPINADNCADGTKSVGEQLRDFAEHYVLNATMIFNHFAGALFDHTNGLEDLVRLKFDVVRDGDAFGVSVFIDHSKLIEYLETLFRNTKRSFEKFRGLLPQAVLSKYEKYEDDKPGTIYWLERHLIDRMLNGRVKESEKTQTLAKVNETVKKIADWLSFRSDISPNRIMPIGGVLPTAPHSRPVQIYNGAWTNLEARWSFSGWFWIRKLLYWSGQADDPVIKKIPTGETVGRGGNVHMRVKYMPETHTGLLRLLYNTSGREKNGVKPSMAYFDTSNDPSVFMLIYKHSRPKLKPKNEGVVSIFNQLISVYLHTLYDGPMSKVYSKSLRAFAEGAFNSAIYGDANINDIALLDNDLLVHYPITYGLRVPDLTNNGSRHVIMRTLAIMIRMLMTDTAIGVTSCPQYLVENIEEVPLYIRERMKANLPILAKLFDLLIKYCEHLRNLSKMFRMSADAAIQPFFPNTQGLTEEAGSAAINRTLDSVVQGSRALLDCIKETLNDLHDDPKYLETREKFIQRYEEENHVLPFMPISSTLALFKNPNYALPLGRLGDDSFKLLYGCRGILTKNTSIKAVPGLEDIIKNHNGSVKDRYRIDEKNRDEMLKTYQSVLRHLVSINRYAHIISDITKVVLVDGGNQRPISPFNGIGGINWHRQPGGDEATLMRWFGLEIVAPATDVMTYQLSDRSLLSDVIRLTESTFQKAEKRKIIAVVDERAQNKVNNRDQLIAHNIIDLNVMPINVHALMREIPLVNIMNYSFSFDKHIQEILDTEIQSRKQELTITDIRGSDYIHGRKVLAHMLVQPYIKIDERVYHYGISRIIRGDLGIEGLGRPRFIGDQLFNKSLFGEIYAAEVFRDGADPAVGHGKMRGLDTGMKFTVTMVMRYLMASTALAVMKKVDPTYDRNKKHLDEYVFNAENNLNHIMERNKINTHVDAINATHNQSMNINLGTIGLGGATITSDAVVKDMLLTAFNAVAAYADKIRGQNDDIDNPAVQDRIITDVLTLVWQTLGDTNAAVPAATQAASTFLRTAVGQLRTAKVRLNAGGVITAAYGLVGGVGNAATYASNTLDEVKALFNEYAKPAQEESFSKVLERSKIPKQLQYLEEGKDKLAIKKVDVGDAKDLLQLIGMIRFDTKLVRDLFWIVNIQRILRLKMRRDLTWYNSRIVSEFSTLASSITEQFGDDLSVEPYEY